MNSESTMISQHADVLAAYEEKAGDFHAIDPRDQYTYMYSKMRTDYALMEKVGVSGKSVLNVGCSFPVDEIYYARKIGRWISVDISRKTLGAADRIVKAELHPDLARKFTFEYADACDLPYAADTFDVSVSMSTFDHLPTAAARQRAVDEMARTTKPGGWVIVTVANRWCVPYALGTWKMMREKTLHYGYAYLFSPSEIRGIGRNAGLQPTYFASSIAPPDVWLPGYPAYIRYPAKAVFAGIRLSGIAGRRIGYAFKKP